MTMKEKAKTNIIYADEDLIQHHKLATKETGETSYTRTESSDEGSVITGKYRLRIKDQKSIGIYKNDGEGGWFDLKLFNECLDKFYKDNF